VTRYRAKNIGLAVGLAAGAAILITIYLGSYRNHVDKGVDLVPVYVAAHDIQEGANGADLSGAVRRSKILRRNVLAGAVSSPAQLDGMIAAQRIYAGEQITIRQFRPLAQQGVLAKLRGNQRALVVPGDANQLLAGIVKDGDHVDVVANIHYTIKRSGGDDIRRVASRVILRNLRVLQATEVRSAGVTSSGSSSITLALTDSQTQKLFFAMKNGDWTLSLRPVAKPNDSPESVETLESILGDGLRLHQVLQLTGGGSLRNLNGQ
jgi:Flp pilus assembly protein CpaB